MLHDKLRELIVLTGTMEQISAVSETTNAYFLEQFKQNHTAAEVGDIQKLNDKYMLLVKGRFDELQEKFINLYAEYYSEEDIDALLLYHKSPIAKKQQDVSQKILPRAMDIVMDFNNELLKQLVPATINREMN